ncbi:MAG TPA: CoA transferase, partial [Accumulibacter sp.]|nr:CoA transferase [Accumulibacter sp.]
MRPPPLAGIRVLDLTRLLPGPLASMHLADLGADVIKVEDTGAGDYARTAGALHGAVSYFHLVNRNKRSIRLDLKDPAQREALLRLLSEADVLVHSMRSNAAGRLGLDYPSLHTLFPRLIYASAPGYSPDGPNRDRPAYDDVIQGESGVAGLVQAASGVPAYFPTVLA